VETASEASEASEEAVSTRELASTVVGISKEERVWIRPSFQAESGGELRLILLAQSLHGSSTERLAIVAKLDGFSEKDELSKSGVSVSPEHVWEQTLPLGSLEDEHGTIEITATVADTTVVRYIKILRAGGGYSVSSQNGDARAGEKE